MAYQAVELFAGMGGWSTGLKALGQRCIGIEIDPDARATRRANGHHTIQGDVRNYGPEDFPGVRGLIGAPPCQPFSRAGTGEGRRSLGRVLQALAGGVDLVDVDPKTALVLEPWRWVRDAHEMGEPYAWVALEQVPAVLPVWEAMAVQLHHLGYSTLVGKVHAEQYGVPQSRQRAVLLARLGPLIWPTPTHSRYYPRNRMRLDPGTQPWVSMASALGWGDPRVVGFPRRSDHREEDQDGDYRERDLRSSEDPSPVVTSKARSWMSWPDHRVRNPSGNEWDPLFPWIQPSPVVTGRPLVTFPGANSNRFNDTTKSRNDGLRITVEEAMALQGFPEGYVVTGTSRESRFRQVGDAVPPPLAAALLGQVVISARRPDTGWETPQASPAASQATS